MNENIMNNLKKTVFHDLLNMTGRVFIVVKYSDDVRVGNRGFLPEEKENGLVLVFNPQMHFRWEDNVIHAALSFGSRAQKCSIPVDNIIAIYSPEAQTQFITSPRTSVPADDKDLELRDAEPTTYDRNGKIVKVDFRKKKQ